jgi:leucyl-tRNA synthetase
MHLLYARFITMALHDMGILNFKEPFKSLTHQGIILAPDGKRMSKSKGNTISPDPYIESHGADVFRCYLMFGFNYVDGGPWDDTGLKAVAKFVDRIWDMTEENLFAFEKDAKDPEADKETEKAGKNLMAVLHNSIKGVTEDTEKFQFNTSIARQMELINAFRTYNNAVPKEKRSVSVVKDVTEKMLLLLAPFAPHVTEELWEKTGHKESIFKAPWPKFEAKYLVKDEITMVVQVNGKIRAEIEVAVDSTDEFLKKTAQEQANVQKFMEGKQVIKIIVIKKKLINIVVK